jgi:acyl-CoA synthetase (NDP forming)
LRDVIFRVAPINRRDAADMISGLRGARLLGPVRGAPPADRQAIEDILLRLSRLAEDFPQIAELDVNPLLAFPDRAVAVDGRVLLGS